MRLTIDIRRRLVADIMAAVPEVDYVAQIRNRAMEVGRSLMPDAVRKIWDDPETRQYIQTRSVYHCCFSVMVPGGDVGDILKADARFNELHALHDDQKTARSELRSQVRANVEACSTDKAFRDRFPELAHFFPESAQAATNLPATTAFMDTLKAAGLPMSVSA